MSDALIPASRSGLPTFVREVTVVVRPRGTAAADNGVREKRRARETGGESAVVDREGLAGDANAVGEGESARMTRG